MAQLAPKWVAHIHRNTHIEWTYFYGVIIVTLFVSLNLYLIMNVLLYYFMPDELDLIGEYFKFIITAILLLVLIYVRREKRYVQIMEKCKKFPKKKKNLYGILSLLYLVILITCNLWIGEFIRDYNLEGKYINLW